jgi:hypothetical protein
MKLLLIIVFIFSSTSIWAQWKSESFIQSVHLHKFDNTIIQGFVHTQREHSWGAPYMGVWFDQDQKTAGDGVFTDSQVAPLVGVKSNVYFQNVLPTKFFFESRAVVRTESFPDDRDRTAIELRPGLLGYDKIEFGRTLFIEHYYALFYTHLYNSRIIFQGWSKQGITYKSFDLFNEVFADTFDFTRGQDATVDLRPGVRWSYRLPDFTLQLIHQQLYHFSNIAFAGRSEARSSLVMGVNF